jgi:hypothetical protein
LEEKMVLTPKQANAQAKPGGQTIKNLEKRIDKALVEGIQRGSDSITLDASIFPNRIAMKAIRELYENVGWTVKYQSDQRDGDYLQFSRKKEKEQYGARPNYLC